jgi:hypothetical protein
MHTHQLRLTGWIQPFSCNFALGDIAFRIVGHLAEDEALVRVRFIAATRHGCPYDVDARINAAYGTWLDLSGTFRARPIDDPDRGPELLGYLEVSAVSIFIRTDATPRSFTGDYRPLRRLTATFPAGQLCATGPAMTSGAEMAPALWQWRTTTDGDNAMILA